MPSSEQAPPVAAGLAIYPVTGLGEVRPGDDLAELLAEVLLPRVRTAPVRSPGVWPTATSWW